MKKTRQFLTIAIICLATILCLAALALAAFYNISENASYLGNLSQQNSTTEVTVPWSVNKETMYGIFGYYGCPPASLTNSLVYLENKYPAIYGTNLSGLSMYDMVYTALNLGDPGTGAPNWLKWSSSGVSWNHYFRGTYNYIENQVPNQTIYFGEAARGSGYPGWVKVNSGYPTWRFLYNHLQQSQAVIIFWEDNSLEHRHYMSLIGLTWDDVSETGTITYVDPKNGHKYSDVPIWLSNGSLMIDYGETANGYPSTWWYTGQAKVVMSEAFGPTPSQPKRFSIGVLELLLLGN